MIWDFFLFLSPLFDRRGSIAESEGDLDGLNCILLYRLGFGGSAQFSEVRWRGTLVLSGSNATPVVSERETSYWSGGVNSPRRNLSSPLLQTTEKCHVRNLLFQSIRPLLCCHAKVFCEVEKGAFWYNHPDLTGMKRKKRCLKILGQSVVALTVFIALEVLQCHDQKKITHIMEV